MNDTELDVMLAAWTAPAPPPSLRRGLESALPAERRFPLRWVVAAAVAALAAVVGANSFDNPVLGRFWGRWGAGGLYMQTTRMIDPPAAQLKYWFLGSGYSIGGEGDHLRGSADMHNRFTRRFYGYEYFLDAQPDGTYRVTFSPLQLQTLLGRMGPYKLNGQLIQPPALPEPRTVHVGESFDVTLWQDGAERVYDRILLSWTAFPDWPPRNRPPSANVLQLRSPQLFVNGQLAVEQPDAGSGPVIWVHLPGQGRFLATMDPQSSSRFQQSGHVNGKVMEFESGGTRFRIECGAPITAGGDHALFVYHQQSFESLLDPAHPLTQRPFLGNAGPASLHIE